MYMNNVNKTTRGKVSEIDNAYTAGLFDGEGSVSILKARRSNPNYKCAQHILCLTCTNTHKETIEWLSETYGASKALRKRQRNHPKWKDAYGWTISAIKALEFLKLIYPYLKIKKEQARIAIEFQTSKMEKRSFKSSGVLRGNTLDKKTLEYREKIYLKMKQLNGRNI